LGKIVDMFDPVRDAWNKDLANRLIDSVGELEGRAKTTVPKFLRAGEWEQAGIEALCQAIRIQQPMPKSLVKEAVDNWREEMGSLIAQDVLTKIPLQERELLAA